MVCRAFVARLAAAAASLSVVSAATLALRDSGLLRWEGPIWPGKPDVVLDVRDVDDLWNRVLTMNPNWVMQVVTTGEGTNLDIGPRTCGAQSRVATGNWDEIERILTRLGSLKGKWRIDANRCHRLGCGNNAGVYWCNDNAWSIRTTALALFMKGSHVQDGCCKRPDGGFHREEPLSGIEHFPDNHPEAAHSWVAVGYGNCKDHVSTLVYQYPYPGTLGQCVA